MPRFQTVVRRARFVYSPYIAYEMQGFAQVLADSIRARIQSGQNIYDQPAAPLKPGKPGRRGYGTEVKDAELRTGLTAKEVGQFGFAAKTVGQDISIVERLMRCLSQAADENSREGEKARAALQRMGIDLHNAAGDE